MKHLLFRCVETFVLVPVGGFRRTLAIVFHVFETVVLTVHPIRVDLPVGALEVFGNCGDECYVLEYQRFQKDRDVLPLLCECLISIWAFNSWIP